MKLISLWKAAVQPVGLVYVRVRESAIRGPRE